MGLVGQVAEGQGLELQPSGGGVERGGDFEGVDGAGVRGGPTDAIRRLCLGVGEVGLLPGAGVVAVVAPGVGVGVRRGRLGRAALQREAGAFDVEAGGVVAGAEHDERGGHGGTFFGRSGAGRVFGTKRGRDRGSGLPGPRVESPRVGASGAADPNMLGWPTSGLLCLRRSGLGSLKNYRKICSVDVNRTIPARQGLIQGFCFSGVSRSVRILMGYTAGVGLWDARAIRRIAARNRTWARPGVSADGGRGESGLCLGDVEQDR